MRRPVLAAGEAEEVEEVGEFSELSNPRVGSRLAKSGRKQDASWAWTRSTSQLESAKVTR